VKARDNPFGAARILSTVRYEGPEGAAAALLPRLEALGYRAAIVGPHGSGKTTLLEDLEAVLAARGFRIVHVRLDSEDRRPPQDWMSRAPCLDARDIVCLDGAEQLGPIGWRGFHWRARRAGGLIITAHTPGRLPTLIACATSIELLDRIIHRLTPDHLRTSAPSESSAALFGRHRGNVRDALRELYDVYASLT
jgi:hypothetical protein